MPKALLIVEGVRLEPMVFDRLAELCTMNVEIVPFRANIYQLYKKLEEYGFDYDVKQVLLEQNLSDENRALLSQKFAYTYLIFDCDAHDRGVVPRGKEPPTIEETVTQNYHVIADMVSYFTDETDPDKGRLYVNYPMMESYRDADSFCDESFLLRKVSLSELCDYKEKVGRRKLSRWHANRLSIEQFEALINMNLRKLNFMLCGDEDLPEIKKYEEICSQKKVLERQREALNEAVMYVINTSFFLPIDYLGKLPPFSQ